MRRSLPRAKRLPTIPITPEMPETPAGPPWGMARQGQKRHIDRMEWSDEGIVLSARPHGEAGLIASMLTQHHGRHAGFIPGGVSRRARPLWRPGHLLAVTWKAR